MRQTRSRKTPHTAAASALIKAEGAAVEEGQAAKAVGVVRVGRGAAEGNAVKVVREVRVGGAAAAVMAAAWRQEPAAAVPQSQVVAAGKGRGEGECGGDCGGMCAAAGRTALAAVARAMGARAAAGRLQTWARQREG